ncbi:MAG: hypothetical protein CSB33_02525 [Desulfobacterales bacterium]|nr:MAG: hypothetical protein CSB33_02525 [Desulfobacterales bacterium]
MECIPRPWRNDFFRTARHLAFLLFLSFPAACTLPEKADLPAAGWPEEIYCMPAGRHTPGTLKVMVFPFSGGPQPEAGRLAAVQFARALRQYRVFAEVKLAGENLCGREDRMLEMAYEKGIRLFFCGDLLFFREGGMSMSSRVEEQVRGYRIQGKSLRETWSVLMRAQAAPAPAWDAVAVSSRGAPAPSAAGLMWINAEKFCRLILSGSRE